jgi:hypothetical protein
VLSYYKELVKASNFALKITLAQATRPPSFIEGLVGGVGRVVQNIIAGKTKHDIVDTSHTVLAPWLMMVGVTWMLNVASRGK